MSVFPEKIASLIEVLRKTITDDENYTFKYCVGMLITNITFKSADLYGGTFMDGYIEGDLQLNYKILLVVPVEGKQFIILTTDKAVFCFVNSGNYKTKLKKLSIENSINISTTTLVKIQEFQDRTNYGRKTIYMKGVSLHSQAYKMRKSVGPKDSFIDDDVVSVIINSGTIFVFLLKN